MNDLRLLMKCGSASKSILTISLLYLLVALNLGYVHGQTSTISEVLYLSGTDAIQTKTWDFMVTEGRNSGKWTTIEVPSHWEQQGFGAYNYGRDNVTFGKNFQYAKEQGLYKYEFTVPLEWQEKQVNLVFEGVMTDADVRVNEISAGTKHKGAFYQFKYDVSDKLKFGNTNTLDVTVSKMSDESSVNRAERFADYWIFGGIYRPVYLEALPKEHIDWTSIDAKANGTFRLSAHLKNPAFGRTLKAEIIDNYGAVVAITSANIVEKDTIVILSTLLESPKLWTAETPNLYTVRLFINKGNKTIFETNEKFGFRTIEVRKGDGVYINGTKIKFKGINRHVFWPNYGRTTFPEADLMDVELMKDMNLNAVRCSHYPPDKYFLQVCDSLGLYVIDELAGWQKAYTTEVGKPLVREMVIRDANHPSVVFWSNGNEGGHNKDLVEEFAKYDLSNRTVIHAHHQPGNALNGIDCNHYEDYYSTKSILKDSNIYMPTEFLHGMHDGGAAAGLADFWELHWNAKRGAGGFIWNLADEAVLRTDRNFQLDANGYNGTDGVVGPYRQKEGSAYALKEIYSPIKLISPNLSKDFSGIVELENRFHFTNLSQCTFQWELLRLNSKSAGHTVVDQGEVKAPNILPLQKGNLKMNLPFGWQQSDVLALKATDPYGREIYRWTWQIKENSLLLPNSLKNSTSRNKIVIKEDNQSLTFITERIAITFDKSTGLLSNLKNDNNRHFSFSNGPVLVSGNSKFSHLKYQSEGNNVVVDAFYKGSFNKVQWIINPNGRLTLKYSYTLNGKYPFSGVSFDYPEVLVTGVKWLGKGPGRVWKNRMQGYHIDVFEKAYNPTETGRVPWIYPEFKGYFADVVWMEMQTMEGSFVIGSPDKDLFVRLFDFYATDAEKSLPKLPSGNISFLDHIPAAGSNQKKGGSDDVSNLGPSSEANLINGSIERTLYFYFGISKDSTENNE